MSFDLLSYDPWTGVRTLFDYDEMTDTMVIRTEQSRSVIGAIMDRNKALQNADRSKPRHDGGLPEMRLVASIPLVIQEKWFRDHGVAVWKANEDAGHLEGCRRLINSRDYCWMKTIPGTV